jgi:PAS fold
LPDKRNVLHVLANDSQLVAARTFCELIPGPASLWSRNRSFCVLNDSATRLTNYSESEFVRCPSLWLERIHADDRANFLQSIEELGKRKSTAQCDYRFFPRGAHRPTWIRENSLLRRDRIGNAFEFISIYTDISDLKSDRNGPAKKDSTAEIVQSLLHEFQNRIQKITMELELAQMDSKRQLNVVDVVNPIKCSLQDIRDQLAGMRENGLLQDLYTILNDVVQKMRKDLNRQKVNLKLVRRETLPIVQGNKDQLCAAFEQVFGCCASMLKQGGNLKVEAQQKEVGGLIFAEVKVTSSSSAVSIADSENLEKHTEGHRIKVGLALAAEILRRHRGQVVLDEESTNRHTVTVLIKASSA